MSDRIAKAIEALEHILHECEAATTDRVVLSFMNIPEFAKQALEALRQPSPAIMPDALPPDATIMKTAEAFGDYVRANPVSPLLDRWKAALSCDAFRNWMGGVGERTLPELPEGWRVNGLSQLDLEKWCVEVFDHLYERNAYYGEGPTPRQAVLAALANIKTEG